jgi:Family of unknown function (DUF5908)
MPVIVRELVIRATVNDIFNKVDSESSFIPIPVNTGEREALIKECVERILEILEKKKE